MATSSARKTIIASLLILILSATGLGYYWNADAQAEAPDKAGMQAPPAVPVVVETIKKTPTRIWTNYSARMEAVDFAEIRPQVSGTITEVRFEDGQEVTQGDILFVIDPRPYEAAVAQAEAQVAVARNQASLAQKEYNRAKELIKTDAISQRIYDERGDGARIAWSQVKASEAIRDQAKINLDYAYLKAPISGRISRAEMTEGNLVEAGPNAPILTSIVSNEGIYADFEVDEQAYLYYVRTTARDRTEENTIPVELTLNQDKETYRGFVHSFDNRIDTTSGTIRGRALFSNERGDLLPGMFANIRMGSPDERDLILIPEESIGTDQDRKFVYIVDDQNTAQYRQISIGESIEGQRVVTSGLIPGDKVITEGIMRVRGPGTPVSPQSTPRSEEEDIAQAQ